MLEGINKNIFEQLEVLEEILRKNTKLMKILEVLEKYALTNPDFKNYYIGAGGINQTVFNYYHGFDLNYGIKDFDIVYYDLDTSYEKEDRIIKDLELLLKDIDGVFDVKNEARVHIWYKEKYGTEIIPYVSVEDAISSWGATITCIGVRLEKGKFKVCCPYGLNDIFSMTIRPVKGHFTEDAYIARANRWKNKWNKLKIISWND